MLPFPPPPATQTASLMTNPILIFFASPDFRSWISLNHHESPPLYQKKMASKEDSCGHFAIWFTKPVNLPSSLGLLKACYLPRSWPLRQKGEKFYQEIVFFGKQTTQHEMKACGWNVVGFLLQSQLLQINRSRFLDFMMGFREGAIAEFLLAKV